MKEYEQYDGLGLAELVERREVKPEELLDAALARLEARDPELNAVVIPMREEARRTLAEGVPEGPFRGVPFLVKDLYTDVKGVRTTNGSRLFADQVPDHDAELTRRFRRAGLVLFGRTHSSELGLTTSSESRLFGRTRNPWNPERTAGGSSGGTAAAVAAGYAPMGSASDGGGSIRIPSSCCGLFGMKPTRARTPHGPDSGEGWSGMSIGFAITRSVRDAAALLDAVHGPDPGAPYVAPTPQRPFRAEVGAAPGRLRIALQTRAWNGAPVDPTCRAAAEDAARLLEELGHHVEETPFPVDAEALRRATLPIIAANVLWSLEERAAALGRPLREDDVEPGTWMIASVARGLGAADYVGALQGIHALGRELAAFLADRDLILTPTLATPPLPLGRLALDREDPAGQLEDLNRTIAFTQLLNATGTPAASLPLFWSEEGLPIGVQLAARYGEEATLLRVAAQCEEARPWLGRRPAGFADAG